MVVVVDVACDSAGMRMLVEYVQEAICWQLDPMEDWTTISHSAWGQKRPSVCIVYYTNLCLYINYEL